MNATLRKFGHPETLIADYGHWCVLLRPTQVTLGALMLGHKGEAQSFAEIGPAGFAELGRVVQAVEMGLKAFRPFDKINYLMLMMVDPHVHFHVLPRYAKPQQFSGLDFPDQGWPGPPNLASGVAPDPDRTQGLIDSLRLNWPKA